MPIDVRKAAEQAAEAIWNDLMDRRGIKHELGDCDPDIQEEIREMMRQSIIKAFEANATAAGV